MPIAQSESMAYGPHLTEMANHLHRAFKAKKDRHPIRDDSLLRIMTSLLTGCLFNQVRIFVIRNIFI